MTPPTTTSPATPPSSSSIAIPFSVSPSAAQFSQIYQIQRSKTRISMAPPDLFEGVVVRLWVFTPEEEAEYKVIVKAGGGIIAVGKISVATHLIACSSTICYGDPICVMARGQGCSVINQFWINDCVDEGRLMDPQTATYTLAQRLEGINCHPVLRICTVGYSEVENEHLKRISDLVGASFYDDFDTEKINYLICRSPDSIEYAKAKKSGIPAVRETWLEDCLIEWRIVPVEMHSNFSVRKVCPGISITPQNSGVKCFRKFCKSERYNLIPASTGRIRERSPPLMDRPHPKVKKSLYPEPEHINFADYLKSVDLTESVSVPEHPKPQTLTNPDVKFAFLRAFALLLDNHLEKQTLRGLFSLSDFLLSKRSKVITINLPLWKYTKDSDGEDRLRFVKISEDAFGGEEKVPLDLSIWLARIRRGTDGFVLRRHINMLHSGDTYGEFNTLYEAFLGMSSQDKKDFMAMKAMDYYRKWPQYPFKWTVLQRSLRNKEKFVKAREAEAKRMQMAMGGGNIFIEEKDPYTNDVQGLLQFIRDTFVHPASSYKFYLLSVMMIEYKNLLADLQEMLYVWGKLPQLKH